MLIGLQLVIIAEIGDAAAIGGDNRRKIGAVALGQGRHRLALQVDAIDFAFDRIKIGILGLVARHQQSIIAQPLRRVETIFAMCHLPRCAAFRTQGENLGLALCEIAGTVKTEDQIVDDADGLGPIRSLRTFGRLRKGCALVGDQHGKGDAFSIRRPDRGSGSLFQLGQGKADPAVLIAQPQIGPAVGRGQVDQTFAVRRPAHRRTGAFAADQRPLAAAARIDGPQVAHDLVGEPVHRLAGVDYGGAVGGNLRVVGIFEIKHALGREPPGVIAIAGQTGCRKGRKAA